MLKGLRSSSKSLPKEEFHALDGSNASSKKPETEAQSYFDKHPLAAFNLQALLNFCSNIKNLELILYPKKGSSTPRGLYHSYKANGLSSSTVDCLSYISAIATHCSNKLGISLQPKQAAEYFTGLLQCLITIHPATEKSGYYDPLSEQSPRNDKISYLCQEIIGQTSSYDEKFICLTNDYVPHFLQWVAKEPKPFNEYLYPPPPGSITQRDIQHKIQTLQPTQDEQPLRTLLNP